MLAAWSPLDFTSLRKSDLTSPGEIAAAASTNRVVPGSASTVASCLGEAELTCGQEPAPRSGMDLFHSQAVHPRASCCTSLCFTHYFCKMGTVYPLQRLGTKKSFDIGILSAQYLWKSRYPPCPEDEEMECSFPSLCEFAPLSFSGHLLPFGVSLGCLCVLLKFSRSGVNLT